MGGMSLWHWLVVALVVMLLFGKGRFSDMMGDVAKGLKSFKKGMAEDDDGRPTDHSAPPVRTLDAPTVDLTPQRPVIDAAPATDTPATSATDRIDR